jgi:hypothetical protein
MARGILALGLAALLVLVLALWLQAGRERTPAALGAPDRVSAAAIDEAAADVLRRDVVDTAAPGTGALVAGPSVQVRVVASDGAALPGVQVRYGVHRELWRQAAAAAQEEVQRLGFDNEALLQRFGAGTVTDGNGIAVWPWREVANAQWLVGARRGDDWGETSILTKAPPEDVHELRLLRDRSLAIRVLDARHGPAAGVELEAVFARSEGATAGSPMTWQLAFTDAAGNAVAPHLQSWSHRILPRGSVLPAVVRPRLPGVEVGQEVDVASPPPEPVVLWLPPTGAIEVTARDALREPLPEDTRITIVEEPRAEGAGSWGATTDAQGACSFPRVGLGRQWRLVVQGPGIARVERVVAGPTSAGEVVHVLLQPDAVPVLTGRLADDRPTADAAFWLHSGDRMLSTGFVRTDGDARFRVPLSAAWLDRRITAVQCRGAIEGEGSDGRVATWRGDLVLTAGEHDLGVLSFVSEPVVAAGQLLTRSGKLDTNRVSLGVEAATGGREQPWQRVRLSQRLQPDGAFSFFGTAPAAPLRLRVETECAFLPVAPVPFAAGARDLTVKLERGGSVKASIVVGSPQQWFCLTPLILPMAGMAGDPELVRYLRGRDPAVPVQQEWLRDAPLEMSLAWPAVAPGRYRLQVRSRGVPVPLLDVPDVVVVDGACNEDPRLQHLQLPETKVLKLSLPQAEPILAAERERGAASHAGVVFVLDGDLPTDQCMSVDAAFVLFASAGPLDFLVRLTGHRDRIVRGVFEDRTIELEPGIALELRCAGLELPAGTTLTLALSPVDDALAAVRSWIFSPASGGSFAQPRYRTPSASAPFTDGRARFAVAAPGRYRLTAQLEAADAEPQAVAAEPGDVLVEDRGGSIEVRLLLRR